MMSFMIYIMFMIFILMMMLLINLFLSKKLYKNREKISPYECGFDPLLNSRLPFSLQFYLISIIFLIFDIEIALLLPMTYSISFMYYLISFNSMMIIFILIFGLILEMKEGALIWFK